MTAELQLIVLLLFYALAVWTAVWLCLLLARRDEAT